MLNAVNRKNKINLADYPYKKDIANRLFLTELSPVEIEVLQELLFQPSKCRISDLEDCLECDEAELKSSLETFGRIGLTMKQADLVFVDKELRKYFEFHIGKFSSKCEPSFESLQGLLSRVPISVLPTWYSIPRTSDNIFASIVEKYLQTPKIYESYLNELTFDDPIVGKIVADVFSSPECKVETSEIRERYKLSREKLQEYILLLEFHFVLASGFQNAKEILTPFAEWAEYLRFQKKNTLKPVNKAQVTIVKPAVTVNSLEEQEEAMRLFRRTVEDWHTDWSEHIGYIEKSVFEIERALRIVPYNAWVLFDDFLAGLIAPIGQQVPISLHTVGKKWRYSLPNYSDKEKAFIELVVFDLLNSVGITSTGTYEDSACFMITPFGRVALGEA